MGKAWETRNGRGRLEKGEGVRGGVVEREVEGGWEGTGMGKRGKKKVRPPKVAGYVLPDIDPRHAQG